MKKIFTLVCAVLIYLSNCSMSQAASIAEVGNLTYDDISTIVAGRIPDGYGNLDWSTWFFYRDISRTTTPKIAPAAVSGVYYAYNAGAHPVDISYEEGTFDFTGAYFTGLLRNGLNIDINGYNNDNLIYSTTIVVDREPEWYELNFYDIDEVTFNSYGGINPGGLGYDGAHFGMDGVITMPTPSTPVPEPSSMILGLISLCGIACKRKLNKKTV